MLNRKVFVLVFVGLCLFSSTAYGLESDLEYGYKTENKEEFVKTGVSNININGEIPDYLRDIYDVTPQAVYNSEYGANVVTPNAPAVNSLTYAPHYAPVNTYTQSPSALITGVTQGTGSSSENIISNVSTALSNAVSSIPEFTYDDEIQQYPITGVENVRNDDGSIGVLRISKIDLKVTAYDGDTYAAMKKGIGHISSTSCWSGNIGLLGHNRGTNDYFGKLKNLKIGDEMTYTTNLGKRTYVVKSISRISDTDWSKLQYTSDNRLTLITCVEDVGDKRLCVQAVEKK